MALPSDLKPGAVLHRCRLRYEITAPPEEVDGLRKQLEDLLADYCAVVRASEVEPVDAPGREGSSR